jgi:hypothetical protein
MSVLILSGAVLAAMGASAGAADRQPVYDCPKVQKAPVIDGVLDDEAWKKAPVVTLLLAVTGEKATKDTKARMCWDDKALYVAFECADEDIWGNMYKRDDWIFREEVVEAFINPSCNLTHYFEFNVSPRNVIFDASIVNLTGSGPSEGTSYDWNCEGLRTAVVVDGTLDNRKDVDRSWTVEMAIPFASIGRATPKPAERWRLNLYRIERSPEPEEYQAWSPTLIHPPSFHIPSRFGTVFFSEGC